MTYHQRLHISARILRAAALYVEEHGYYLPLSRVEGDDPDFDWDHYDTAADCFDRSSPTPRTPSVSETGAIAMVVYGQPGEPIDDGSAQHEAYADAMGQLCLMYAPDREGYGSWIFPHELAADLRAAAAECEFQASQPFYADGKE